MEPGPQPSVGNLDNNLDAVSAASATDAWAVGDYYPATNPNVLQNMAEHWNGTNWTEYALPGVGLNQDTLLGVSKLPSGHTWAVGYTDANWLDQTLVEYYNGSTWSVVPSPSPGAQENILTSVAAICDTDVCAVGEQMDAAGTWHAVAEHWDGTSWSLSPVVDAGPGGNELFGVHAVSSTSVYAVGDEPAVPGGGVWAVGVTSNKANNSTLIAYHC